MNLADFLSEAGVFDAERRAHEAFARAMASTPHVAVKFAAGAPDPSCATNVRLSAKGGFLEITIQAWHKKRGTLEPQRILAPTGSVRFYPASDDEDAPPEIREKSAALYERFATLLMEEL